MILDKEEWVLIYQENDYEEADQFYNKIRELSKGMGIQINEPEYIEVKNRIKNRVKCNEIERVK